MDKKAIIAINSGITVAVAVLLYTPPRIIEDISSGLGNSNNPAQTPSPAPSPVNNPKPIENPMVTPTKRSSGSSGSKSQENLSAVITDVEIDSEKTENNSQGSGTKSTPSTSISSTSTPSAQATQKATPTPTPTPVAPKPTPTPTPTPTPPPPTPVKQAVNGTFTGDAINVSYGIVQVRITVTNNKITDAQAIQSPTGGKSGSISNSSIPILRQETLAAQSANIRGVSGASFTSNGWIRSLTTAISRAGI
jgi:uncharacterized protein with FMN-binding domain